QYQFLPALPDQSTMRNTHQARQPIDSTRRAPGFAPQPMVDSDCNEPRSALARLAPARGEHQESRGVRSTGYRKDKTGSIGEWSEQRLRLGGGDRRRIVSSGHAFVLAQSPVSWLRKRVEICA